MIPHRRILLLIIVIILLRVVLVESPVILQFFGLFGWVMMHRHLAGVLDMGTMMTVVGGVVGGAC